MVKFSLKLEFQIPTYYTQFNLHFDNTFSRNISEELSSIPLSHLVGLMPSVEESQSAEAAITPAKANITSK